MLRFATLSSASLAVLLAGGCPEPATNTTGAGAVSPTASIPAGSPSEAVLKLQEAAKANDVEAFKKGLSKNLVLTIERLQEVTAQKAELKGAFRWETFMSTLGNRAPKPREDHQQRMACLRGALWCSPTSQGGWARLDGLLELTSAAD